ncbi:unnamed protein product, partial [Heterosigma akashiwo]
PGVRVRGLPRGRQRRAVPGPVGARGRQVGRGWQPQVCHLPHQPAVHLQRGGGGHQGRGHGLAEGPPVAGGRDRKVHDRDRLRADEAERQHLPGEEVHP